MPTSTFTERLNSLETVTPEASYQAEITDDWLQGRTGFGGILSAIALSALRQCTSNERPLRALLTSFVGPVESGQFSIDCRHLRSGKSVTWADATIHQNNAICTTLNACFAADRQSQICVNPSPLPNCPGPDEALAMPFLAGLTPNFTQHFDMRWAIGKPPVSKSEESKMGAWVRFKEPGPFTEFHIVTLMDLLPPAVIQMFSEFKPLSSLTWHLELLSSLDYINQYTPEDWWFFYVEAKAAGNGYSQQQAYLYDPKGTAIAISQQSVAIFA